MDFQPDVHGRKHESHPHLPAHAPRPDRWSATALTRIVVSRGCPHHCDSFTRDAFFEGGTNNYCCGAAEVDRPPGRQFVLDDHLLGNRRFAEGSLPACRNGTRVPRREHGFRPSSATSSGSRGCSRHAQRVRRLRDDQLENLFARETPNIAQRTQSSDANAGVMVNGSLVFGLDDDGLGRTRTARSSIARTA